ncbi:NAD(P)-dependent dehydrogenase (short-subunit alcohol dehydrogenase family) [Cryobacterium sp. MP_M5]|uniref:SDR family NAD(P)-dependent oxidoreductase n=1 Tax=unclassified Cryobacterium TaxID=2649013 RepID=UPI0018C93029|nr:MULTISPECIES: SDR family NAD(P)-dependent oxidoreductase [unclassified Cryobacterium]MBG6057544.1 NAD(P)-dependent dehydrogenase (short-subunit alcohol dehydrogenase family) [Cryobacterium sp. MP_M3]MEC5175941.1 NAD(P)-dependent dehydrogenase (short-subunit alcohol dehydrogenase family) [Cryobacterium sp. MP_M5]
MNPEKPMSGRTVLITGGTAGIGRATALGLARLGAHVAITGRDRGRAEDAAREIRAAAGGRVTAFVADLSSQGEVHRLAGEALLTLPRIDVLVNNVGGYWRTTSPNWPTSCSPTNWPGDIRTGSSLRMHCTRAS